MDPVIMEFELRYQILQFGSLVPIIRCRGEMLYC